MALYFVDGNNLEAYLAEQGMVRSAGDVQLLAWLGRWQANQRRKRGKSHRVTVVFDSGALGKQFKTGPDLVVKVAPAGVTADDIILRELQRLPKNKARQSAVLVTSDRGLSEQARMLGVEVIECERFVGRLQAPPAAAPGDLAAEKQQTARQLGHSVDELFVPGKPRQGPPPRTRLSPQQVGQLRDPNKLEDLYRDGDRAIRRQAVLALTRVGTESARKLLETALLRDPVPSVRAAAASALGRMVHRQSLEPLERAARDEFSLVRAAVAEALARYPRSETQATLESLQSDPSRRVRHAASEALARSSSGVTPSGAKQSGA